MKWRNLSEHRTPIRHSGKLENLRKDRIRNLEQKKKRKNSSKTRDEVMWSKLFEVKIRNNKLYFDRFEMLKINWIDEMLFLYFAATNHFIRYSAFYHLSFLADILISNKFIPLTSKFWYFKDVRRNKLSALKFGK